VNLALFDFDGTITTREMFPDFMRYSVAPRRLAVGKVLLAPWIAGYRMGVISGSRVRSRIVDFGFRGVPEASVREAGRAFARDVLPGVVRPEALDKIRWHQTQGDRVVVVSGSLDVYLSHWCGQQGLELICSRLETADGRLTGRYLGAQCVGEEKSRRVRGSCDLDAFAAVYAYGDTHEDLEMLNLADRKYFCWQEVA
jgi:HAD superfamily hydrolase (TIGR01490 family)